MHYLLLAIDIVTGATFFWIVATFGYCWATESGSFWQRTLAAGRDSATIVWSKLMIATGAAVAGLVQLADAIGQPDIAAKLHEYLTPQIVGYVTIAVMLVTVLARKRSL